MGLPRDPALHFLLKVASRAEPETMSDEVLDAALRRIREHCARSGQPWVQLLLHAEAPTRLGPERFEALCLRAREHLREVARVQLALQTHGTRLDARWAEVLARHEVRVGVGLAGPESLADTQALGLEALRAARVPFSLLTVIPLGAEPLAFHRQLMALEPAAIEYRFPDGTHDTLAEVHARHGRTPCADFLLPVFEEWWRHGTMGVRVEPFVALAQAILGNRSEVDCLGNLPPRLLFIGPGGAVEGLGGPRVLDEGLAAAGVSVLRHDLREVALASPLHRRLLSEGLPPAEGCGGCAEVDTCAGGHLAHRYSRERRFDNPSVWCEDLLRLFAHLRERLGIPHEETRRRARVLEKKAQGGRTGLETPREYATSHPRGRPAGV